MDICFDPARPRVALLQDHAGFSTLDLDKVRVDRYCAYSLMFCWRLKIWFSALLPIAIVMLVLRRLTHYECIHKQALPDRNASLFENSSAIRVPGVRLIPVVALPFRNFVHPTARFFDPRVV